jgi:hypothetical protein
MTATLFKRHRIYNKVLLIIVIAVMSKVGFHQLKRSLFGYVSSLAPWPHADRQLFRIRGEFLGESARLVYPHRSGRKQVQCEQQ